jgi:hypothetical protein
MQATKFRWVELFLKVKVIFTQKFGRRTYACLYRYRLGGVLCLA